MPYRLSTLVLLVAITTVLVGCGDSEGERTGGDGLTAELAVPPAAPTVAPTPTPEPTATVELTATMEPVVEKQVVNIPNRGYNSLGDPDAPITMFDFSDFL